MVEVGRGPSDVLDLDGGQQPCAQPGGAESPLEVYLLGVEVEPFVEAAD